MNYLPIFRIDETKDDYIRVRDYLIEFLEELRQRNRARLELKSTQQNDNQIQIKSSQKKKPIQIEVKIIDVDDKLNQVDQDKETDKKKSLQTEVKLRPRKKRNFKFSRFIPDSKLSMFEDITLQKIENEYKSYQQLPYRSSKRRSLFVDNRYYDTHSHDSMSKSLRELLKNESKQSSVSTGDSDKSTDKYSFYNEFCQRLKQNDPYYNSNLAANYPNLNIIH